MSNNNPGYGFVTGDGAGTGGGGANFAIGPEPNEFRGATRADAVTLLDTQSTDDPAWLAVYDAAPLGSEDQDALHVRLFYSENSINYLQLLGRDNNSWVVDQSFEAVVGQEGEASTIPGPEGVGVDNASINDDGNLVIELTSGTDIDTGHVVGKEGPPGAPGSGATSSFASLDDLNSYYEDSEHLDALKNGTNATVTEDGLVYEYLWEGEDSPATYDPADWAKGQLAKNPISSDGWIYNPTNKGTYAAPVKGDWRSKVQYDSEDPEVTRLTQERLSGFDEWQVLQSLGGSVTSDGFIISDSTEGFAYGDDVRTLINVGP
ncbi:MAG: hypothetical protein GY881_15795, partial [Gammaproteobacteria bacterium]|nr:hypothetical protein [Gammaproteobacteria bacterium]